jgi:multiple sugar transport system ATP-binding protein
MNIVNVGKAYGSLTVIHGVSVEIPDGEFVVLVGPSGCGKSTLLRMVAGLEPITFGDIRIDGKVVNDLPPKDRDIAMVFQSYALYPHKTVAQNMGFALKMRGETKADIEGRVRKAAEILDLVPYLARYPRQLSGGQRQRVAMGRAIEPLSNLDAKLRVQMRAEIKELQRRLATTMIYVTHDQVEAMTMADRIVVLRDGRVEQIGSPLTLYDTPANTFVAGFIGSPSMNLIKGHIRSAAEPFFETDEGIRLPLHRAPAGSDGRPAFYGIRPEHFTLGGSVSAHVTVVESTGSETQVFAKLGQQKIIGVFRDRVEEPSDHVIAMTPNAALVHLFDGESGLRLI